tara:strand:- start:10462 stop:10641 length:180 start_codon:yes stop_codon:yes gene_type:complete
MKHNENKTEQEPMWIHESDVVRKINDLGIDLNFVVPENKTEHMIKITNLFSDHYQKEKK